MVLGVGIAGIAATSATAATQPATSYLMTKTSNGNTHNYACTPMRTIEHPAIPITYIKNNCSTRVLIPQGANALCLGPGVVTEGSFTPASIGITGRVGPCDDSTGSAARTATVNGTAPNQINYALLYYGGQFHDGYQCNGGADYPARNGGYTRIVNECSVRVWLKGPPGAPGSPQWSWCASPFANESIPSIRNDPSIIQITHNTSPC